MKRDRSWVRRAGIAVLLVASASEAWAGGFESPDVGAEAMGRGGAFTAKADDGTALQYNIAGFARQRGTRLYLDGKISLHDFSFQRSGSYPSTDPAAYANTPYGKIGISNGFSLAPVVALSTDFGYFDRWTFVVGLLTPSAQIANRDYPSTVNGAPAPQRYDVQNVDLLVVYPMVAAAVRVTKWLDIGLALQMVYGSFDLTATAYADLGCTGQENPMCDSQLHIKTTGFSATGTLGLMFHPLENLHLGLQVRGPMAISSSGDVTATTPGILKQPLDPGAPGNPAHGELKFRLPLVVRLGVRYAFMKNNREQGDIELDGTYEAWKAAQGEGDVLHVPQLGPFSDISATLEHKYKDGGSVRLGGSYNLWLKNSVLAFRLGIFYDASVTDTAYTRVDFDTLDKIGYALGLGYTIGGVSINAAYTYVYSPDRTVTDGNQRVINGVNGTTTSTDGMTQLPVYNNGTYHAATQFVLLSVNLKFDQLLYKHRKALWGEQPN